MNLNEMLDLDALEQAIAAKYVKRRHHLTEPLAILNYTATCVWEKAWTPVTRACRGLIYRTDTGEVVARPFPKFFNYGELAADTLDLDAPVRVTDKADGSLGILYPLPSGGYAVATRGSFSSDQARHATDLWRQRYADVTVPPDVTLLFEIIYRENRIVLDYGDLDDLMFLTAIDIPTGRSVDYDWQGLCVPSFDYATLAQALTAPPRPNSEGLVVYFPQTDERIKLKQDDYVALHRVLTGLTPRNLWEFLCVNNCKGYITETKRWQSIGLDPARATQILAAGEDWFETMIANVPDEFFDWAKAKIAEIHGALNDLAKEIYSDFNVLLDSSPDRKTYSELIRGKTHAAALFLLYDNKQIATYLWKQVYPSDTQGWRVVSEDVA